MFIELFKKAMFIGYVNKLLSNYDIIQPPILINLFKSYCRLFYHSMLWRYNSDGFDQLCKRWSIAIRTLLDYSTHTHTQYLGPYRRTIFVDHLGQQHMGSSHATSTNGVWRRSPPK